MVLREFIFVFQVLPDGTVVKVNKTIIHDTSEDGSSFFFHQTSYHNFGGNSDQGMYKES